MEGIIYKTLDYKEKSKLIYLYTPLGLESYLASGAKDYKKGMLSGTEIITYISYNAEGTNLKSLKDIEIKNSFKNIKENLLALAAAESILDIVRQTNDERNEKIFNFTLAALNHLELGLNPYLILFIYLIKMLKVFGILDLSFKSLNQELRKKAGAAYYGSLDSDIDINKEELMELIGYYESFDFIYLKNVKQSLRYV